MQIHQSVLKANFRALKTWINVFLRKIMHFCCWINFHSFHPSSVQKFWNGIKFNALFKTLNGYLEFTLDLNLKQTLSLTFNSFSKRTRFKNWTEQLGLNTWQHSKNLHFKSHIKIIKKYRKYRVSANLSVTKH